jgi:hypothetical protein
LVANEECKIERNMIGAGKDVVKKKNWEMKEGS